VGYSQLSGFVAEGGSFHKYNLTDAFGWYLLPAFCVFYNELPIFGSEQATEAV
jgi:hypothetical protein